MDFQQLIDGFFQTACVISVRKKSDGSYEDIRIVAGNKMFIDMAENPPFITDSNVRPPKFISNSPYEKYLPKTANFEDLSYRAAVLKKTVSTYINLNVCDMWFNMTFIPVDCEDGDVCYCIYTTEPCDVNDINPASTSSMTISTDVLRTCIKLRGTNNFKMTINEVIQDIREMCGAEVCTLMLMDEENGKCNILAKSTMRNSSLKTVTQFTNFYDIALSWRETLGERDCIIIKDAKDMEYISETNNMWYLTLEEAGVESVVLFPLRHNREMIGYIWATNFNIENTQRIKETLELTTFFLSSEIAGYNMMTRLEHIGYTDLLTGINNRNAMNNRIMGIVSGDETISVPYGVVFADLNGLKRVNDEGGHAAGDLLLKKAALILQEVFVGDSIYRAGGDEFMIIASDISESAFNEKIYDLRKTASDPDSVCFSVGSFYNSTGSDIRDAMRIADEAMYKDKEEYYAKYPERKYR